MNSFVKDIFAIFAGAFLGALFAHTAGWLWPLGILSGGAIGYATRMFIEPQRTGWALRRAFRAAFYHYPIRLLDGGLERIKDGLAAGIFIGNFLGVMLTFFWWLAWLKTDIAFDFNYALLTHAAIVLGALVVFSILTVAVNFFFPSGPFSHEKEKTDLRNAFIHNSVTWHVYLVYYFFVGCWKLLLWLPSAPHDILYVLRFMKLFLKTFVSFVHSEDYTACGIYSVVGATAIFLWVPYEPLLMAAATLASAVLGAIMRRIVLRFAFSA